MAFFASKVNKVRWSVIIISVPWLSSPHTMENMGNLHRKRAVLCVNINASLWGFTVILGKETRSKEDFQDSSQGCW